MRCIYSLICILAFLLALAVPTAAAQQTASFQEVFTGARPGARVQTGPSVAYHQIAWVTSGSPGACYLSADYSNDGMVWYLGGTIPGVDCTRSGQSVFSHQKVRFVRMNLTTLAGAAAVRATYSGFQTNPGPQGSVNSVFGRIGDVQAQVNDYNVSQITGAAGLFSPNFQGQPTAPNPPPSDNSNAIATTAWVQQNCCGGGGGGGNGTAGVSSFAGRTGPVVPQASDYAAFFAPIGGGGGGGGTVTSFSAGSLSPLFTTSVTSATTTPVLNFSLSQAPGNTMLANGTSSYAAPSWIPIPTGGGGGILGLTSDGTTLTFSGSGGITAPSFHVPSGAMLWDSVTGPVPTQTAPAGHTQLVAGPDGWYTSTNAQAWTGPLGPSGGAPGAGVASFNARQGAVVPVATDYPPAFIGAAPNANAHLTGIPTAPTAALTIDDTQIATTAFVHAAVAAGGGGGTQPPVAVPIARRGPAVCQYQAPPGGSGQPTVNTFAAGSLDIQDGDTVVVTFILPVTTAATPTSFSFTESGSNVFSQRVYQPNMANGGAVYIFSTNAGEGHAATSLTATVNWPIPPPAVTISGSWVCVATYTGVHSIGEQNIASLGSQTTPSITIPNLGVDSWMIAATFGSLGTWSIHSDAGSGTIIGSGGTADPTRWNLCENHNLTSAPADTRCKLSSTALAYFAAAALELVAGATGPGTVPPPGAKGLTFGDNPTIPLSTTNPGIGQYLMYNGTSIVGAPPATPPGGAMIKINGGTLTAPNPSIAVAPNECETLYTISPATGVQEGDIVSWNFRASTTTWSNGKLTTYAQAYNGSIAFRGCNIGTTSYTPTARVIDWYVAR